ncbi:outer membrane protein [Kaarinaea lacus]
MNNITNNEANFTIVDEKDTASAFQIFLGIFYSVTNNIILKADYRYLNVDDVSYTGRLLNNKFNQEGPELHNLAIGVLYKF